MKLKDFFHQYIENTPEKSIVVDKKMFLCSLTVAVARGIKICCARNTYVTTRALKHLYDKKPAEEFLFIVNNLRKIMRYPDKIYLNPKEKRGNFAFVKTVADADYFCSMEIKKIPAAIVGEIIIGCSEFGLEKEREEIHVVTAFRLRDRKYLKNYTLLWDWGDGAPHRSALDTPKGVY